jgi:hypothetical protein
MIADITRRFFRAGIPHVLGPASSDVDAFPNGEPGVHLSNESDAG